MKICVVGNGAFQSRERHATVCGPPFLTWRHHAYSRVCRTFAYTCAT